MKRVKMVLAYDGTNYCGWQLQPNGITIEGVLNQALSELLREPVAVIGASRTDMPRETWRFLTQRIECRQKKYVSP